MYYKLLFVFLFTLLASCAPMVADLQAPVPTSCHVEVQTCADSNCGTKTSLIIELPITPEQTSDYTRQEYLSAWADIDHDCQNTRDEILITSSLIPPVFDQDGCSVKMGLWYDPYTDATFEKASDLGIDHVVALKEAHESGGDGWDSVRRGNFANDMSKNGNLIAVWNSTIRSKGALDPSEWLPPNPGYQCEYVQRWVQLKNNWELSVDINECNVIQRVLSGC